MGSVGPEVFWLTTFIGAILIALLYEKSPSFRYRFKFVTYIVLFSIIGLCMIPFCLFRPKDVRNVLIGVPFIRQLSNLLGIKWEVSGKEVLEKDFPCVVVCNHQSMLDVLATVELWPTMKKCACIAKREIIYVIPFGTMAWLCGTIFINRRNSNQSQMKLSTTAEKIREDKTKLWIFPEGTRSKKHELLPFKKGAFHIALMNKLPIVPVVVSPYCFVDDVRKTFDSGTMKIKVLDPVDTSSYHYPEDVSKLLEHCHELMNLEYQKMWEASQIALGKRKSVEQASKTSDGTTKTNPVTTKSNGHCKKDHSQTEE